MTANYTAEQLVTQREDVRGKIIALLTTKMQSYGVHIDSLNIVNFQFSDAFTQAIESKVTAVQNADAAKNKLAQVQYEAQQTVAKAQGDAEAIKISATHREVLTMLNYSASRHGTVTAVLPIVGWELLRDY